MKHRGQQVTLKKKDTGELVKVVVVLADTNMGYLAADASKISPLVAHFIDDRDWSWYHPSEWKELSG